MGLSLSPNRSPAGMDELKLRLAKLQDRFTTNSTASHRLILTGWDEIDARLQGGLATRAIHEWFRWEKGLRDEGTEGRREDQKSSDPQPLIPLSLSPSVPFRDSSPPLSILIHLAWRALEDDPQRIVLWIGHSCRPYFRALVRNPGCAKEDRLLLEQSIFIDAPANDVDARLWAIDLAARSPAVACVVADGSGLDMRASRRLQLAAQQGSALVLLAKPERELKHLSAAATRWIVTPGHEGTKARRHEGRDEEAERRRDEVRLQASFDQNQITRSPDRQITKSNRQSSIINRQFFSHHFLTSSLHPPTPTPRWTVTLLRCKGLQPVRRAHELPCEFALEVCRETGSLRLSPPVVDRSGQEAPPAQLRRSA